MFKVEKRKVGGAQRAGMEAIKLTRTYIKTPDSVKDKLNQGSQLEGGILYNIYCATCHQRNGMGDNNRYPPLAGSELVNGDKERLIGIVLNGLQGEIEVMGKTFNGLMPAHRGFLDDGAVASILSYIRKNRRFKNESDPVTPLEVNKMRGRKKK